MHVDEALGSVLISPRRLGLRRAGRHLGVSWRMSGRILSADLDGIVVDLGGVEGFAPRRELELDWLLAGPELGSRFRGYVTAIGDAVVSLSRFGPRQRSERTRRRATLVATLAVRLDEPAARSVVCGLVLAIGEEGALVSLEDGLIEGLVPGLALGRRDHIVEGRHLRFRVIGRPQEPDRDLDLLLWPHEDEPG